MGVILMNLCSLAYRMNAKNKIYISFYCLEYILGQVQ
jgi:hypothetical protein